MNRSGLVFVDKLFFLSFWMVNAIKKIRPKSAPPQQNIVVFKFFGMGSLTRIAHVIQTSNLSVSITLVTLQKNKAIVDLLGMNVLYIKDRNFFLLIRSLLAHIFILWKMKNVKIVDMERSSNLAGIYTLILSIGKAYSCFTIAHKNFNKWGYTGISLLNKPATTAIAEILNLSVKGINNPIKIETKSIQLIGININSGNYLPERRYDFDKYAELVQHLAEIFPQSTFVFTGDSTETERVKNFCKKLMPQLNQSRIIIKAGQGNLKTFADQLQTFDLFLTNDSGPLHLAKYFNVKTVAIWGPTSPELVGYPNSPFMHNLSLKLACSHCFQHPKSKVAKACNGEITCFKEMNNSILIEEIKRFVGQ